MEIEITERLIKSAAQARSNAYAPYSGFTVGAALLTASGQIFTGSNIENASYSATVCAERTAFFRAVSEGGRDFVKMAVCGGQGGMVTGPCPPCGICRQVMAEFCRGSFEILVIRGTNPLVYDRYTLDQLLPVRFTAAAAELPAHAEGERNRGHV